MQIKLFTIPITDSGASVEEMNRFLCANKILEVENRLKLMGGLVMSVNLRPSSAGVWLGSE
jgi:hypothetical protein